MIHMESNSQQVVTFMNTYLDIFFTILWILHVAVAKLLKEQHTYFPTAPISTLLLNNLLNNIKNCKEEILSQLNFSQLKYYCMAVLTTILKINSGIFITVNMSFFRGFFL